MKTVRINRKYWLRGNSQPFLHDPSTNGRSCLGFTLNQISQVSFNEMDYIVDPLDIYMRDISLPDCNINGYRYHYMFLKEAILINFNINISDREREKRLIDLFDHNQIKLEFYGFGRP